MATLGEPTLVASLSAGLLSVQVEPALDNELASSQSFIPGRVLGKLAKLMSVPVFVAVRANGASPYDFPAMV